jgi:hypothetical protein
MINIPADIFLNLKGLIIIDEMKKGILRSLFLLACRTLLQISATVLTDKLSTSCT